MEVTSEKCFSVLSRSQLLKIFSLIKFLKVFLGSVETQTRASSFLMEIKSKLETLFLEPGNKSKSIRGFHKKKF